MRCPLLEFNKPSGVNAVRGTLEVGGGAGGPYEARWLNSYQNVGADLTLYANGIVNLNNHNEDFGPVTFNGGEVDTGTGQFAFYQPLTVNPAATTAVINGNLGLPPGIVYFNVGDGSADPDLLVNAVVFGSGSPVVKARRRHDALRPGQYLSPAPPLWTKAFWQADNATSLGDPLLAPHHRPLQRHAAPQLLRDDDGKSLSQWRGRRRHWRRD